MKSKLPSHIEMYKKIRKPLPPKTIIHKNKSIEKIRKLARKKVDTNELEL